MPNVDGQRELPTCLTLLRSSVVYSRYASRAPVTQGSLANFLSPMRDGLACSRLASRRRERRAQ
jgi:hypothetical protein